jgi:hypothetical protein
MWVPKRNNGKKKKIMACSLIHNILKVGRHARASRWDWTNPQAKVQDEINLHNQEKKVVSVS